MHFEHRLNGGKRQTLDYLIKTKLETVRIAEPLQHRQHAEDPTLTRQISSECVHCVGFRWPKTTILGKF